MIGIVFVSLIIGVSLSTPGLGLKTQTFINSLKKDVNKNIPKGTIEIPQKLVDSTQNITGTNFTLHKLLEYTYENDCLSTLTPEQFSDQTIKNAYINFADFSFENNLKEIEHSSNNMVDMNIFSMKLFDFDVEVAKSNGINQNTINNGFARSGLSWYSHGGLKELLNSKSNTKQTATDFSVKTTPKTQSEYNSQIQLDNYYIPTKTSTILVTNPNTVTYSLTMLPKLDSVAKLQSIVANKIWFFNEQLRTLLMLNYVNSMGLFGSSSLDSVTTTNLSKLGSVALDTNSIDPFNPIVDVTLYNPISANDLKQPNYVSAFELNQAGLAWLFFIFPVIFISSGTYLIYYFINNKNILKKKSINNTEESLVKINKI